MENKNNSFNSYYFKHGFFLKYNEKTNKLQTSNDFEKEVKQAQSDPNYKKIFKYGVDGDSPSSFYEFAKVLAFPFIAIPLIIFSKDEKIAMYNYFKKPNPFSKKRVEKSGGLEKFNRLRRLKIADIQSKREGLSVSEFVKKEEKDIIVKFYNRNTSNKHNTKSKAGEPLKYEDLRENSRIKYEIDNKEKIQKALKKQKQSKQNQAKMQNNDEIEM
jgi:hypothetical protein